MPTTDTANAIANAASRRSSAFLPLKSSTNAVVLTTKHGALLKRNSIGVEVSHKKRSGQIAGLDAIHQRRFNLLPDLFKTSQASTLKSSGAVGGKKETSPSTFLQIQ